MGIKEKLDLLSLSEKERKIAEEKFLAPLSLVTYEELKEIVDYLEASGIYIRKAREIKVVANPIEEIIKKYNILKELGEVIIYVKDVLKLNQNALDIFKRIQYCKQHNIAYKNENDVYEAFLFSERAWQEKTAKETEITRETANPLMDESIVSIDPVADTLVVENNQTVSEPLRENPVQPETSPFAVRLEGNRKIMDIPEFQLQEDVPEMTSDDLSKSVEKMLDELESDSKSIDESLKVFINMEPVKAAADNLGMTIQNVGNEYGMYNDNFLQNLESQLSDVDLVSFGEAEIPEYSHSMSTVRR